MEAQIIYNFLYILLTYSRRMISLILKFYRISIYVLYRISYLYIYIVSYLVSRI